MAQDIQAIKSDVNLYGYGEYLFKSIRHARKVRNHWCPDILSLPLKSRLALRKCCDIQLHTYCEGNTYGKRSCHAANMFLAQFRKR